MASKITKVRVVRCPKCFKLLPEIASLSVYQCGGCGTTLKAKKLPENQEGESSGTSNQNSRELQHGCEEDKELPSTSQKATMSSSDGCEQIEYLQRSPSRRVSTKIVSSPELERHGSKESLSKEGNARPDGCHESGSDLETPSPDNRQIVSSGSDSTNASPKPLSENVSPILNTSSSKEDLDKSEIIVRRYADLIGARGSAGTAEATDDSMISEDDLIGVSKPSTTKSFHAYDASISSNDGWGDQMSNIHSHLSKRSSFGSEKLPESIDPNRESAREGVSVSNRIDVNSELHNQARKFSLMSLNEKHASVSVEAASLHQDVLPENTRYGMEDQNQVDSRDSAITSQAQSWLENGRQELRNQRSLGKKVSSAGYQNRDPSKYRHKKLIGSCLYSPENIVSVERNQMELLRKVDELRDQLNRSYDINGKANERFVTKGNQQERSWPLYYNQNPPDHDMLQYYDVNLFRRSPGRYLPGQSLPLQCGYSQMPPVGNVMHSRHHANCLCLNAYKEDWQYPQQLPPNLSYNEILSRPCLDHVGYGLYGSSPSSPVRHLHSRYPLQCCDVDTLPYNHIGKDRDLGNLHRKERRQSVKKHCRPITGGAPIIICYHCQNVLYLPADSFLSNKRYHRLQCGSCSKVLTFSLHKGTHLAPYPQNPDVPSRREVYDSSASTSMENSVATFNSNDNPGKGDAMSYSEDFGRSTFKSISTVSEIRTVSRKQVLSKLTAKKSGNKQKKVMHASDSDGPSSDDARLPQELLQKVIGPTLHELMGYSSPGRVLNASSE